MYNFATNCNTVTTTVDDYESLIFEVSKFFTITKRLSFIIQKHNFVRLFKFIDGSVKYVY